MALIRVTDLVVDEIRCRVRASGPQTQREAIVFVHGNPGSSEDWTDLLQRAGDFTRAIAPDFPSFGSAERTDDFDYSVPGYANYIAGVLAALGIERVHLVLHDFGCPWGLQWAADHPEQVASLTLFNMGILPGYHWHKYAQIWRLPIIGELFNLCSVPIVFKTLMNADNPAPFPAAFLNRMAGDYDAGLKRAVLKLYRATPSLSRLTQRCGEILKPYALPALVIWGDGDKYLPVKFAPYQAHYFRAETHILHGVGHWPMIDRPEAVRDLVIPFLRRQCAPELDVAS